MAAPFQNFGITPGVQAEAPKRPHLYIGNLSPRVNDQMLTEIFAVAGSVVSAKIVQDRNYQHGGFNYGFVEYADMRSAEQALATLNGRKIFDAEVRVNWAYQGQQNREDTQHHYHVFVGDLSPEVNDEVLGKAFGAFGTMSEARVMWDMNSGKSRGYGFLSFREKADAEQAIATMNGEWLGSRAIRVNWANQKTQTGGGGVPGMPMGMGQPGGRPAGMGGGYASPMGGQSAGMQGQGSMGGMHAGISPVPSHQYASNPLSYEAIAAQTPDFNATVYVGNLIPYTTQADLIPLFQGYGYIVEIRMQADRGFAFVKLDSHHNAAMAITHLQNQPVHGRPIKCSWGKDKGPEGGSQGGNTPVSGSGQPGGQSPYPMVGQVFSSIAHLQHSQQQQWGSNPQYGYYGGYAYGQTGVPGQPGSHVHQSGHHDQNGHAGQWDSAAAQAFYQSGGGWGNYYAQGDGSTQSGSANH